MENKIEIKEVTGYLGHEYKDIYVDLAGFICNILRSIPKENKWDFIRAIGCDEDITEIVVDRLIDAGKGYSNSSDSIQKLRLLEKSYLNDYYAKHKEVLETIERKIKILSTNNSLYYKLYHDPELGDWFRDLSRKRPDLNINEFSRDFVSDELKVLQNLYKELIDSVPKLTDDEYEILAKLEEK